MDRIRRMFKWAVENEIVPPAIFHGLIAVRGLQRGRTAARETERKKPVAVTLVDAVRPYVSRHIEAIIDLQLLTGARPGEICAMRACDLDTSGRIWIYKLEAHKTEHHGHQREIYLGPRAQDVVKPFLKTDLQAYLFSPREAEAERLQAKRAARKTKVQPSQVCRKRRKPKHRPGILYDVAAYRRAIARACAVAFPLPEHLGPRIKDNGKRETDKEWKGRLTPAEKAEVKAWRRAHSWHPHQLRHNAATALRKEFGVEIARIILGHATAFTTGIYAETDRVQAMEVIGKIG